MVKFVSADGRAFTDYKPNCDTNNQIQRNHGITNNYDYRMFLQRNGNKLMQKDRMDAYNRNKLDCNCPSCIKVSSLPNKIYGGGSGNSNRIYNDGAGNIRNVSGSVVSNVVGNVVQRVKSFFNY